MKRHSLKYLDLWHKKQDRKPLVIRGPRQVGKSTLVRLFCREQNLDLIEINLEKIKIKSANSETIAMSDILDEIQMKSQKKITANSVVFLDEIQEQPNLLKILRYFFEEHSEIAVIAAGSLLEIALHQESISFPVGRIEFHYLGPMTFTEFLFATGHELLAEKISQNNFSESVCDLAQDLFCKYLYVGGMPEAIKTYATTKSLIPVREVQEQILQTYLADFPKYNKRINSQRVARVFLATISQLGKKVIYQRLDSESSSKEIRTTLELLLDARVLQAAFYSAGNSIPLSGESDDSIYKIYFLDIGLLNCLMRLDLETLNTEMSNNFNSKGIIAEQFVAQHLAYLEGPQLSPQLFYWLRDKGSQKAEIDFLVQVGLEVLPVEVKAAETGHLKSLFYFAKEKNKNLLIKLSLAKFSVKNVQHSISGQLVKSRLVNIPIWATEQLVSIISDKIDKKEKLKK